MAVTVAGSKIDYSQLTALRMSLRDRLQAAVQAAIGQNTIIRDMMPSDVSGAASGAAGYARLQNKTALVANTWLLNDWGNQVLPVNKALGIFAFIQLQPIPAIDAISFSSGGAALLAQFFLDVIYADQFESVGYFDPPVVFSPQQPVAVNLLASSAVSANAEFYGLQGYVCEPPGITVAPDQALLV